MLFRSSALGAGCDQLQSVNLSYCGEVTDAGASALGAGCDQLQSVNLSYNEYHQIFSEPIKGMSI